MGEDIGFGSHNRARVKRASSDSTGERLDLYGKETISEDLYEFLTKSESGMLQI